MRLSTDQNRDEELALETIAAAVEAGVTVFDTARAYGRGSAELGHNEAVALTLGLRWRGLPAWFIARTYHLLLMPGLGRKLRLLVDSLKPVVAG